MILRIDIADRGLPVGCLVAATIGLTTTLGFAACGSSAGPKKTVATPDGRVQALAIFSACLRKKDIPSGAAVGPLGVAVERGVSRVQLEVAAKECGFNGTGSLAHPPTSKRNPTEDPIVMQKIARYAACLRRNGINVPPPSSSSIFDTSGVDTGNPKFKTAAKKCRGDLLH